MPDQTNSQDPASSERRPGDAVSRSILVAHVTVHLLNGESFQLLPFQHAEDVKTEVSKLIESWSQTGFLLRERLLYPWHQVKLVEVTSVEELSTDEAAESVLQWEIRDQYRVLDSFWKTRKPASADKDKDEKKDKDTPQEQQHD